MRLSLRCACSTAVFLGFLGVVGTAVADPGSMSSTPAETSSSAEADSGSAQEETSEGGEKKETASQAQPSAEDPVFVVLARDPYIRRYGRPPGEGWIPVPGTRTELKFGGFIQLNIIHDFENAGFPYGWFVPAAIPVPTVDTPNTEFDARASRFVFETRTNTEKAGSVRTVIDIDFYGELTGSTPEPRLREAYVTWVGPSTRISFSAGQTWSTFLDLGVWPEILDLQGPNSMTGQRQGLLRGAYAFGKEQDVVVDLAIEQPSTQVQNGNGLKDWPDFVARLSWQRDWGHLQGAAIGRRLVAEDPAGEGRDSAFGYGLSLSGSWMVPGTRRKNAPEDNLGPRQDSIQFQVQSGSGTGRYVFDLASTTPGQDAVYDDVAQTIEPLDQFGWFAAYRHWWTGRLRSQLVYGVESVDNLSIQGPTALDETTYALANLAYRAFERMDIGIEYSRGERRNADGEEGRANRLLLGLNFGF